MEEIKPKLQFRLFRDLDFGNGEVILGGSVGIVTHYGQWGKEVDDWSANVRFADSDVKGFEEGKHVIGYPGGMPVYEMGKVKFLEEQFGINIGVYELLTTATVQKFEAHEKYMKFIFRQSHAYREEIRNLCPCMRRKKK